MRRRKLKAQTSSMPINETQLNGRIATLLDRMNVRWNAYGETQGVFKGNQRQPDVLVYQQGGRPVIVENEYLPARTVDSEAISRLGEKLDANILNLSGEINAVVALRTPLDLRRCRSHDQVDELLSGGIQLEYALYTGASAADCSRFPTQGFIPGAIKDLAAFISYASVPEDAIEKAIDILIDGLDRSATILRDACEESESTREEISNVLQQEYSDQTLRMASAIMINAIIFHLNLSGKHGVPNFHDTRVQGIPISGDVQVQWHQILQINYWSIFKIALDLLQAIASSKHAAQALHAMVQAAEKIEALGVAGSHDLIGTVFQRLIADRKYLATFYTRPESATLLAHLAIPDDGGWDDPERVKNFHIADYACGTGTLVHAAYRRINQLHLLSGGRPETLHSHMMQESLTACDVVPSAVHLTASMLSSSHPEERYESTRTIVAQYGKTEDGGISIGSLDLLASNGEVRPLIALHSGTAVTATGGQSAAAAVEMPQFSQDLVIMNPPFTRSGSDWEGDARETDYIKPFRGLGNDLDTQRQMTVLKRKYGKGTCAHGYAGIASWFVALADRMAKSDGTIALVLPMTALQGTSWQAVRKLIANKYNDVVVITIATASQEDQSFSADTGMAETLIVCRQSDDSPAGRGMFISLNRRPLNEMEAMEMAKAIDKTRREASLTGIEEGLTGGNPIMIGDEMLGVAIDAPLNVNAPWHAAGASDLEIIQSASQLATGVIWFPRMRESDKQPIPIAKLGEVGQVGMHHMNIVGNSPLAPFELNKSPRQFPTFPMLWNHDTVNEAHLIVMPDSEGRVKRGMEDRAFDVWDTRSHTHYNTDFRFNSQPLCVAFTLEKTIGGTAWPNVAFPDRAHEIVFTLWGNTSLGLLIHWYHASRQQAGRGRMPITAIRTMPTLDVTKLSDAQLQTAEKIFDETKELAFLPANEAYRDDSRKLLDRRVLIDLLKLPESVLEPIDVLRLKWCSEPSVHGGKGTAPME